MHKFFAVILFFTYFSTDIFASGTLSCSTGQSISLNQHLKKINTQLKILTDSQHGLPAMDYETIEEKYIQPLKLTPSAKFKFHRASYRLFHHRVNSVLQLMSKKIKSGFNINCVSSWSVQCRNTDTNAYVLDRQGQIVNTIYLCPRFFKQQKKSQLTTLFHELSHLAEIKVEHFLGSIFSDQGMRMSAYDAYFYEKLVGEDWLWHYERNSWRLMWYPQPTN